MAGLFRWRLAAEAFARTARWYVDNRPDASFEERLGDPLDYAWEDRMIEGIGRLTTELQQVASRDDGEEVGLARNDEGGTFRPYPYAHPTQANQARDHRGR